MSCYMESYQVSDKAVGLDEKLGLENRDHANGLDNAGIKYWKKKTRQDA